MKGIVLIPAYKPDDELIKLVDQLTESELGVLIVDDGSGEKYSSIFDAVKQKATVVSHSRNMGKGKALKTGIKYIKDNCADCEYFITADADGQHKAQDILRVKERLEQGERMVLTTRNRSGKIPFRSSFGNSLSSFIYALLTGVYYKDNQSGLRGFAKSECEWLLLVKGNHYNYEMNVIYHAERQRIKICKVDIEAIYIDGNKSSHFNPVKDTLRIYKRLFISAMGTLFSAFLVSLAIWLSPIYLDSQTMTAHFIYAMPLIGLTGVLIDMILTKLIFLRKIRTRDYLQIAARKFTVYLVYGALSYLSFYFIPSLHVALVYSIILLVGIIPRYYIIKGFSKLKK